MGILRLERAYLVTPEGKDGPLHALAAQWIRTEIHEAVRFNDLRDRLLADEGGAVQVNSAQMNEVLALALEMIGQSLRMNPRGTLALLDECGAKREPEDR